MKSPAEVIRVVWTVPVTSDVIEASGACGANYYFTDADSVSLEARWLESRNNRNVSIYSGNSTESLDV